MLIFAAMPLLLPPIMLSALMMLMSYAAFAGDFRYRFDVALSASLFAAIFRCCCFIDAIDAAG